MTMGGWYGKKHSLDSGVLKRLLLLLGLSDEEGSSPGPLDSKPAVQCLQAPNALLDNPPFFFEKKSKNSYKLYKYL